MNGMEFKVKGLELIERPVKHYKGTGSRVVVPSKWNLVKIIRIK